MGFLNKIFGKSSPETPKLIIGHDVSVAFVEQLETLGYYKYADTSDIEELKKDMIDSISQYGVLSTVYNDDLLPKDYRYYMCDGENVYEQGGFTEILSELQRTFDKIGLRIEISNHHEVCDENTAGLDHWITINGKEYIIFKNFKEYGWGEAVFKLAEILNEQLELQNKSERIFLINGGNDGALVFLTEEQNKLIASFLKDDQWRPLDIQTWCKVMQVDPNYNSEK